MALRDVFCLTTWTRLLMERSVNKNGRKPINVKSREKKIKKGKNERENMELKQKTKLKIGRGKTLAMWKGDQGRRRKKGRRIIDTLNVYAKIDTIFTSGKTVG